MHKLFVCILALAALAVGTGSVQARETEARQTAEKPLSGVIRVKLQPEAARLVGQQPRMQAHGKIDAGTAPLSRAAAQVKAVNIRPMLPYNAKFAAQRAKYGLDRWYVVEFDHSVDADQARKIFAGAAGVEKSEAIVPMELKEGTGGFVSTTRPPMKATAADYRFNGPHSGTIRTSARCPARWPAPTSTSSRHGV